MLNRRRIQVPFASNARFSRAVSGLQDVGRVLCGKAGALYSVIEKLYITFSHCSHLCSACAGEAGMCNLSVGFDVVQMSSHLVSKLMHCAHLKCQAFPNTTPRLLQHHVLDQGSEEHSLNTHQVQNRCIRQLFLVGDARDHDPKLSSIQPKTFQDGAHENQRKRT